MNSLKKFIVGFGLGIGIAYWYLHYYSDTVGDATNWFSGNAASIRGDKRKDVAESLGR